jgi:hypothetical protein
VQRELRGELVRGVATAGRDEVVDEKRRQSRFSCRTKR